MFLLQICIKWGLQHGTSVIPKATGDDHVIGNLDVLDWELSSEDYEVSHTFFNIGMLCCNHTSMHQACFIGRALSILPRSGYHKTVEARLGQACGFQL